ncbi:PREDICTED: mucolipin-2 [Cyprinodon variegatus]|uniref:mucolipin-2 n=1 Tax=Cyprinodon variegatus TaxID=28743 RepID=UPI0007425AB9|nr:PREDICTED: mucolipin-2 [Cyprinodon variegatus]
MELLVRYLDRSNSIGSDTTQDLIKEESLRDDLRYYFMSPCEKYRTRRHIPWKMGVQILKIVMITTQLILFGLNNQLVVAYKEETTMALKNLFLKGYTGVDEDDYSIAVYTQNAVFDRLFYVLDQYSQLDQLSVGPISYAEDEDGKLLPLTICKEYYKRGSLEPSNESYDIDARLETGSFCNRSLAIITFDNQCHSGKVKLFLDIDAESSACKDWKISGTAQKNTHYLLVFDAFVILVCITSAALCTRSIILAVRLLQRFSQFFQEHFHRKVCEDDQSEFLNGWYVLVIISDLLAIIGSILKMEIQAKSLTSYDVCSIFLGTSTLLVWVGVIRYLGYFQKYNVLILTMKAAFPKVLRFCCCAGMIYLGYTFCGWIVLGPYHEKFEGLSRVAECLFSLLNGDDMFTTFAQLKDKNTLVWLFSRAYLYSFISLFIYMVLSLFIALITDSYETIKNYQRHGFPLTDLQKFLQGHKDFPVQEENGQTEVELSNSINRCCCCQRYDSNAKILH